MRYSSVNPYSTKGAFTAYKTFLALKRHFNSSYDYFKYNGQINASFESFEKRRDKFHFYKISKIKDYHQLMLSNFIDNPGLWIGDLLSDKSKEKHNARMKRIQSLMYHFKGDVNRLDDEYDENFIVKNGQNPRVLSLYYRGQISLETLVMLIDISGCFSHWDKNISDKISWEDINSLVTNYSPFLDYDMSKAKAVLRDRYTD